MDASSSLSGSISGSIGSKYGSSKDVVALKKTVGIIGALGLIMGTIIGSGIFITPAGVASNAGSPALSLILWTVGGIISLFASLSVTELGIMIPSSGGEILFIKMGLAGWLAFLWTWTSLFFTRPGSTAATCLTCAEYILVPIFNDDCGPPPDTIKKLLATCIILLISAINAYSVRLSTRIMVIFTVAKLIALIIIIVGGLVKLGQGLTENLAVGFTGTNTNVGEIFMGFYSVMFAYDGWLGLTAVTEEIIKPEKNMKLAVVIGLPIITILYVIANVSYFTVLTFDELTGSSAVALTWSDLVIPRAWWIMSMFVAMSTFGGANGGVFSVNRLIMVSGREGYLISIVSMINPKRHTPFPAIILYCALTIIYIQIGSASTLIDALSFAIWMFYAIIMIALLVMRVTKKDLKRPYKVPLAFPIIVLIFAVCLVIFPIVLAPQMMFLYAACIIVAGIFVWLPFVHFMKRPGFMKFITVFFQLILEAAPGTEKVPELKTD